MVADMRPLKIELRASLKTFINLLVYLIEVSIDKKTWNLRKKLSIDFNHIFYLHFLLENDVHYGLEFNYLNFILGTQKHF